MSKEIQVGDLAMVVNPRRCSCPQNSLGRIIKVCAITPSISDNWRCPKCWKVYKKLVGEGPSAIDENGKKRGLYRLKRIPPLDELEGQRTEEKLREPSFTD